MAVAGASFIAVMLIVAAVLGWALVRWDMRHKDKDSQ